MKSVATSSINHSSQYATMTHSNNLSGLSNLIGNNKNHSAVHPSWLHNQSDKIHTLQTELPVAETSTDDAVARSAVVESQTKRLVNLARKKRRPVKTPKKPSRKHKPKKLSKKKPVRRGKIVKKRR